MRHLAIALCLAAVAVSSASAQTSLDWKFIPSPQDALSWSEPYENRQHMARDEFLAQFSHEIFPGFRFGLGVGTSPSGELENRTRWLATRPTVEYPDGRVLSFPEKLQSKGQIRGTFTF